MTNSRRRLQAEAHFGDPKLQAFAMYWSAHLEFATSQAVGAAWGRYDSCSRASGKRARYADPQALFAATAGNAERINTTKSECHYCESPFPRSCPTLSENHQSVANV